MSTDVSSASTCSCSSSAASASLLSPALSSLSTKPARTSHVLVLDTNAGGGGDDSTAAAAAAAAFEWLDTESLSSSVSSSSCLFCYGSSSLNNAASAHHHINVKSSMWRIKQVPASIPPTLPNAKSNDSLNRSLIYKFDKNCNTNVFVVLKKKQKGDYVWLDSKEKGEFEVPIGARVVASNAQQLRLVDDEGADCVLPSGIRLKLMHTTSVHGVEDMIALGDLNEAGILRNLLVRYKENIIYVSSSSSLSYHHIVSKKHINV